jgi:H+/gluconate symporter-like permease
MGTLGILISLALLMHLAYRGIKVLLLAPLFGKPMDNSGSARAIAHGIVAKVGSQRAILASGGMDTLPHNGAVIPLLAICTLSRRESYTFIFANSLAFPLMVLAVLITLGTLFGSF